MATISTQGEPIGNDLKLLQALVYQECGMYFDERRVHFLQDRLHQRLKACQLSSLYSYYRLLTSQEGKQELVALLENLTINETSFFRNRPQLELLRKPSWKRCCDPSSSGETGPCGSGVRGLDRPGALHLGYAGVRCACLPATPHCGAIPTPKRAARRVRPRWGRGYPKPLVPLPWRLEILASDINYAVLHTAQQATYTEAQMENVDYSYRLRYFDKISGGRYTVKPALKQLVHFDFHNLKTEFLPQRNDIIFCRNVIIYFDEAEQKRLIEKFWHCLKPEGYLFLGHTESLYRLSDKFQLVHREGGPPTGGLRRTREVYLPRNGHPSSEKSFCRGAQELLQALNEYGLQLEQHPADPEFIPGYPADGAHPQRRFGRVRIRRN